MPTDRPVDRFHNCVYCSANVRPAVCQVCSPLSRKLRIFQSLRCSSCGVICSGAVVPSSPSILASLSSPILSISSRSFDISAAVSPGALDNIFFSVATSVESFRSFFFRRAARTLWFRSVRED